MQNFLTLHQTGEAILVNAGQIQSIWAGADYSDDGSTIYFAGEPDGLSVDESFEDIMTLIEIAEHG